MIEDDEISKAFRAVGTTRDWTEPEIAYEVRDFLWAPGSVDLEVAQRGGASARLRIDLPSSRRPQPWLYMPPENALDWVHQFFIWLDEEVHTGGLSSSRARVVESRGSYVVVEPNGWRPSDTWRKNISDS